MPQICIYRMKKGKNGASPIFKRSDGRGNCKMGPAATAKWGLAPFSQTVMNRFCCHCEERSDVAIPYNKLSLLEAQKIPSLCSGQMWQYLKKRNRDEHREVIEYAV